jgi:hypothetical protein
MRAPCRLLRTVDEHPAGHRGIHAQAKRLQTASAPRLCAEHCRARAAVLKSSAISKNLLVQWRKTSGRWPVAKTK